MIQLLWLALLLGPMGCQTSLPGLPLSLDDPRPARLLAALTTRADTRRALRARAKLALDAPDLRLRRPERIAIERPGRLRVEILGIMGQLAAVLVTRGGVYQVYNAGQTVLEEGVVEPDLLWRVARVDLEPDEAVDLLLGAPQPRAGLSPGAGRRFADGEIELPLQDAAGTRLQRFRFDAAGRVVEVSRFEPGGQLLWRCRFSDFRAIAGLTGEPEEFAFSLDLDFPRVAASARLDYKNVELAAGLPDELFMLRLARTQQDAGTVSGGTEAD